MSEQVYSKDDVEKLAETVMGHWENHSTISGYLCNYCFGHNSMRKGAYKLYEGFNHEIDCPVFVAQDVLTTGK